MCHSVSHFANTEPKLEPHCRYKNTIHPCSRSHRRHSLSAAAFTLSAEDLPNWCCTAAPGALLAFANPTDGGWRQSRKCPAPEGCGFWAKLLSAIAQLRWCSLYWCRRERALHTKDNATVWSHANSIRSRGSDNFLRVCFLIWMDGKLEWFAVPNLNTFYFQFIGSIYMVLSTAVCYAKSNLIAMPCNIFLSHWRVLGLIKRIWLKTTTTVVLIALQYISYFPKQLKICFLYNVLQDGHTT